MKLQKQKNSTCIYLEGEITVNNAEEFKKKLLIGLEQSDVVEVDFEAVTVVDLSCIQLLYAAHRFSTSEGKVITVRETSVPALQAACEMGGFSIEKDSMFASAEE